MMPLIGAAMVVSIFMASVTSSGVPLGTLWPFSTSSFTTEPDRVAPTSPGLLLSAFFRATFSVFTFLSKTSSSRGMPLNSKDTVRLPFSLGSLMWISLMMTTLPFSISTSTSSPTVMPKKKVGVSSTLTSPYSSQRVTHCLNTSG